MSYSHSVLFHRLLGIAILLSTPALSRADVVTGFTLVDAGADTVLFSLDDGDTLDLGLLPPDLALQAETDSIGIGSVSLELIGPDTTIRIDNSAPYTVHGDGSGNYFGWQPQEATYTLTGTPYQYGGATGTAGTGLSIQIAFTIADPDPAPVDTGAYLEADGLVIIEAETESTTGELSFRSNLTGYTYLGYLEWKYGDYATGIDWSGAGPHVTYEVKISNPGRYKYEFRTAAPEPNEHNDIWVRFPDNGAVAINAVDTLDLTTDWFKVYQNESDNQWTWQTKTVDGDAHAVYTDFDSAGIYRIQFAGRSTLFKIDRMVLYSDSVSASLARDTSLQESLREGEIPPVSVCERPLNPGTTLISPIKATLYWDTVAGADGYLFQGRVAGDSTWFSKKTFSASKTFNFFSPGSSYEWRVAAACIGLTETDTSEFTSVQAFTMDSTTKLENPDVTNIKLNSYPNPASERLTFSWMKGISGVEVIDASGRLVYSNSSLPEQNQLVIGVQAWPEGVYLARFTDQWGVRTGTLKVQVSR